MLFSPLFVRSRLRTAVSQHAWIQAMLDLDAITDGELRRFAFYGHFVEAMEGFDVHGGWGAGR